jgi:hypothetical protein
LIWSGRCPSTKIGSPIQSITPLQYNKGNLSAEVLFIEYFTPISATEMPPSEFFFNKKRRVVVKREIHQKEGATVTRHRMLFDGGALEEADFTSEVVGSLGAFATTNSVFSRELKRMIEAERSVDKPIA